MSYGSIFGSLNKYSDLLKSVHIGRPDFIPAKHPTLKYADHKRLKAKRKNKRRTN